MNGHPRDQAKVSVHCRWPLIRGNLTLKCVGRGIDNMAVQGRWPLTTGVAQGRYYCIIYIYIYVCSYYVLLYTYCMILPNKSNQIGMGMLCEDRNTKYRKEGEGNGSTREM